MRSRVVAGTSGGTGRNVPVGPGEVWTWENVGAVLRGAFEAMLASPLNSRDLPRGVRGAWPDWIRNVRDAYGYEPPGRMTLRPEAAELDQACEVIVWIMWIESPRDRAVVAGRLCGVAWRRLARFAFIGLGLPGR